MCLHAFFRVLRRLVSFASNSDWLISLFASVVIGQYLLWFFKLCFIQLVLQSNLKRLSICESDPQAIYESVSKTVFSHVTQFSYK